MSRGTASMDTGIHESLLDAGLFVQTIQQLQGLRIARPEEIAYRLGYITANQLGELAQPVRKSGYVEYLRALQNEPRFTTGAGEL